MIIIAVVCQKELSANGRSTTPLPTSCVANKLKNTKTYQICIVDYIAQRASVQWM